MSNPNPIGIDLGTTESVLAYVNENGQVKTWKPEGGSPLHASAVLIDSRVHVGDNALKLADDKNTLIEGFKRDMGKSHCSTRIAGLKIPPEILSGFVLEHIKTRAESDLGPIKDVVVSVPAYFDAKRRRATQEAGRIAGLNVVAIINEPTAASIGYSFHKGYLNPDAANEKQNLLVYDFGGGTFDVTLLQYANDKFKTLSTDGDVRLGGIDMDERLAEHLSERFYEKFGIDPRTSEEGRRAFTGIANETKHGLTHATEYLANLNFGGERTNELVIREEFNGLIEPYIERTIATCEDLLYEAGDMKWKDVDTILLVGGSSQIPFITQKLQELTGILPTTIGNPQELVAEGCALYAANLAKKHEVKFDISNVNSHSLGIRGRDVESGRPINRIIVPRNTALPITVRKKFVTYKNKQKSVKLILLEGESENPELCYEVGKFRVELGPDVEKGERIDVFCKYNADGTIHVTASLNDDGASGSLEISRSLASLDSLDTWRKRLTSATDSMSASESFFGDDFASDDLAAAMKDLSELDTIYHRLGESARMSALPETLVHQQRYATALAHKIKQIGPLVEQLGMEVATIDSNAERQKLRASINMLKSLENQHRKALRHVVISLGRNCFRNGIGIQAIGSSKNRIEYLEKAVQELWT